MIVTLIAAVEVRFPCEVKSIFDCSRAFFVVIFSHHFSNLNFRKDTFLNANSYSTLTSLNYPHSLQNGLTSKAVKECSITVFCRIFSGRGFYLLWFHWRALISPVISYFEGLACYVIRLYDQKNHEVLWDITHFTKTLRRVDDLAGN